MIDILSIKPNVVSRDLKGYSFLIYGGPKTGKTTLATRFPKHLLIAAEKGYGALPGVMALPINSWSEFIQILNQLKGEKRKQETAMAKGETYDLPFETIIIDVVDILYDYCEKFILSREGVDAVADIPYGGGYAMISKEFDEKLRSIVQMGYGLIMISHAAFSTSEIDGEIKYATPTLAKRPKNIVERLVDIFGYITIDNTPEGIVHTMHFRSTPAWEAGARFKYMPESIELSYKNLVDAIHYAIDTESKENNGEYVTESFVNNNVVSSAPDFLTLRNSIDNSIKSLMGGTSNQEAMAISITSIVEEYLGKGKKISNSTPDQVEQLVLINERLQNLSI